MADRDEVNWIRVNEPWRLENLLKPIEEIKTDWYLELTKIKGIGRETANDIGTMFYNLSDLKIALTENKVALRNDIVKKLKREFL